MILVNTTQLIKGKKRQTKPTQPHNKGRMQTIQGKAQIRRGSMKVRNITNVNTRGRMYKYERKHNKNIKGRCERENRARNHKGNQNNRVSNKKT